LRPRDVDRADARDGGQGGTVRRVLATILVLALAGFTTSLLYLMAETVGAAAILASHHIGGG
jgi:hypothetical protein